MLLKLPAAQPPLLQGHGQASCAGGLRQPRHHGLVSRIKPANARGFSLRRHEKIFVVWQPVDIVCIEVKQRGMLQTGANEADVSGVDAQIDRALQAARCAGQAGFTQRRSARDHHRHRLTRRHAAGWIDIQHQRRMPGVGNAPLLIRSARELGYEGLISTETAQDAKVLAEGAGELANGFISVGGASTPEIASDQMKAFVAKYTEMFGEYNDESNTKVYALDYILETLKANPAAIDNVEEFKKTMDTFSAPNPYLKGDAKLTYVGTSSFGQKRQVAVPMVVNEYKDGAFQTLFVGTVD